MRYVVVCILLLPLLALGQQDSVSYTASFVAKPGIYNPWLDDVGLMPAFALKVGKNDTRLSADISIYREFNIWEESPNEYYNQIGLLIGKRMGNTKIHHQLLAGPALFWGLRRTNYLGLSSSGGWFAPTYKVYDSKKFITAGLLAKYQITFVPVNFYAFGLEFFTNVNIENPVFGVSIVHEIGKLK